MAVDIGSSKFLLTLHACMVGPQLLLAYEWQ